MPAFEALHRPSRSVCGSDGSTVGMCVYVCVYVVPVKPSFFLFLRDRFRVQEMVTNALPAIPYPYYGRERFLDACG